ncbi:MAG: PEP/pyruvate-binding domain-containing protein [Bacteroidota bacterium]
MTSQPIKFDKKYIVESKHAKFQDFHNLMSFRIRDIILVSSMYDFYLFEEDGRLYELIRREYQGLNLSNSPELVHVSSGEEAIELARTKERFNLIITTLHVEDMDAIQLAEKIKQEKIDIPVVLLGYDNDEMTEIIKSTRSKVFDKIFMWQGDFRIIFGIIKYFEDRKNIQIDTTQVGVQVIILIEDSVRFYSSYLPIVYTEVVKQANRLMAEGVNLFDRFMKMRARPKIILCSTYEEAWDYYKTYQKYILGVISDVDFIKGGKQNKRAGLLFAKKVKDEYSDLPILLQSNNQKNEEYAHDIGASFVLKSSSTLMEDLRKFMNEQFSFGDFIFRLRDGIEVGRAVNLIELGQQLALVPEESVAYHSSRNHFSNWLKARGEFWLAYQLRPRKVDHYRSMEALREDLMDAVRSYTKDRQQGVITDFDPDTFDKLSFFARIGGGSIGGKARGLGFFNNLLSRFNINRRIKNVNIWVPTTVVVATNIFDQFMEENVLINFALKCESDEEIRERFISASKFPHRATRNLRKFLKIVNRPLAVRSSSLLEDSQGQPFAGVYDTLMLPNNHHEINIRLEQLIIAIKQVYASTYFKKAKQYINVTSYRLEEEKMAVIIQKMVGETHNDKYYPEISGMAKSYNFYPTKPLKSEDGIVSAAFGLGKTIVEGGATVRFCPRYPLNRIQQSTVEGVLNYSQRKYFALDMVSSGDSTVLMENDLLKHYEVHNAEKEGTLAQVGSTYSHQNNTIYDGTSRDGLKIFTLNSLLKFKTFPLPEIVDILLDMGRWGMSTPIEIEFAVNLSVPKGVFKEFGVLQMRPLVINTELEELDINGYGDKELVCRSNFVLGNGISKDIRDIVFVDAEKYERSKSIETAKEVAYFNAKLQKRNTPYLLIGVGRWGSFDPWLGIPVTWDQISGAKAIIESNFHDFDVEPSQGSHFFQNLTSFKVGYFTVNEHLGKGFIDWKWLEEHKVKEKKEFTYHIKLKSPLTIKINGHENKGLIIKPNIE